MNSSPFEIAPSAPDWFRRAIAHPVLSRTLNVEGCLIHYLAWFDPEIGGAPSRPGLLLIHGGGAHANWWRFIAPFFAGSHRVCAIDLSGMGDSGTRDVYTPETWTAEIDAVLNDAKLYGNAIFDPKPLVVGHSFGGFMAIKFGAEAGHRLGGTVIVDSPVQDPTDTPLPEPANSTRTSPPIYKDRVTALSRFRLMPDQPCENSFIKDFIAQTSIRELAGGWTWKFDFKVMGSRRFGESYRTELKALKGRTALIHGDKSAIVSPKTVAFMSQLMGPGAPVVEIPEAHHHLMLDQPLAFVTALRAILDKWLSLPA